MEHNHSDRVLAFDSLFTTNHIQILKLLVGFAKPAVQGKMAVYIKFLELQHTLQMVARHPSISITPGLMSEDSGHILALLDEMYSFCLPRERKQINDIKNMFQTFENMQGMMEMIELLKEMNPEMFSKEGAGDDSGGFDFSRIMNMTQGTDMSQMMEMVNMMQGMFSSPEST